MPSNTTGEILVRSPPFPASVGLWIAVATPTVMSWAVSPPAIVPAALWCVAAFCLVLALHSATLLQRRRGPPDTRWWLSLELLLAGLCAGRLAFDRRFSSLLIVAVMATLLLAMVQIRRRATAAAGTAQITTLALIALLGPASWVVANHRLGAGSALLYLATIAVLCVMDRWLPIRVGTTRADQIVGRGLRHNPIRLRSQ